MFKRDPRREARIPEYIMCSVPPGDSPLVCIGVMHRPPHIPFLTGSDLIDNLMDSVCGYNHKIIMGDLNSNLLSASDDVKFVRNLANEL